MSTISTLFAAEGKLCDAIEGFVPRAAQTEMAVAVESAINC
jgi:ATP-dependent DNA helicase DinG